MGKNYLKAHHTMPLTREFDTTVDSLQPDGDRALDRARAIVETISDRAFAGRLFRVYEEAAVAISGMGQLELAKYEQIAETGSPDTSMWEEISPVVRETVADVNRFLSIVRQLFPLGISGGIADLIGEALIEASAGSDDVLQTRHKDEATHYIQVLANALASEVSNLSERMKSPAMVSDRWNMLSDLQEIRGKFRSLVGEMVFLSASAFTPVSREEVIPGYSEDLREAIEARRAVIDLARLMASHYGKIMSSRSIELPALVSALVKDLDVFGRSKAYILLRTLDKRRFVEFRSLLHGANQGAAHNSKVATAVAEFAYYAHGLAHINRRACLMEHDRDVLAVCTDMLENAEFVRQEQPGEGARLLSEVLARARDLYGRHPSLDSFLRRWKGRSYADLTPAELEKEIEQLRSLLLAATAF